MKQFPNFLSLCFRFVRRVGIVWNLSVEYWKMSENGLNSHIPIHLKVQYIKSEWDRYKSKLLLISTIIITGKTNLKNIKYVLQLLPLIHQNDSSNTIYLLCTVIPVLWRFFTIQNELVKGFVWDECLENAIQMDYFFWRRPFSVQQRKHRCFKDQQHLMEFGWLRAAAASLQQQHKASQTAAAGFLLPRAVLSWLSTTTATTTWRRRRKDCAPPQADTNHLAETAAALQHWVEEVEAMLFAGQAFFSLK